MRKIEVVERVQKESRSTGAACDKCGRETEDYGTASGPIDWDEEVFEEGYDGNYKRRMKERSVCCWVMDSEEFRYDTNLEAVLCPDCFKEVLGPYFHEVKNESKN